MLTLQRIISAGAALALASYHTRDALAMRHTVTRSLGSDSDGDRGRGERPDDEERGDESASPSNTDDEEG